MKRIFRLIRNIVQYFGYDIIKKDTEEFEPVYAAQFRIDKKLAHKIQQFEQLRFGDVLKSSHLLINKISEKPSTIFDIGGNTGMFSLILLNTFKDLEIHIFEPVKEYIEFSKIRLNNNKCIFNNVACSNNSDVLELHMDGTNIGWNTLVAEKASLGMTKRSINCIRLSEYIRNNNIHLIDAIKIDVEGHEFYILEDLLLVISTLEKLPMILVEIGWGTKNPVYKRLSALLNNYFKIGYKKVKIDYDKTFDLILEPIN